jgi:hypothetical protein
MPGWPSRPPLNPEGGRGTERSAGLAPKPPRDCGPFDSGPRDACMLPMGGRGTLRAICGLFDRPISEPFVMGRCGFERPTCPFIGGRCPLLSAGRATVPRTAGDGTRPEALSGPCGMIRDGVRGSLLPANGFCPPDDERPRLKLAGGDMRDTTGRVALREGGVAARCPACTPSMALRVGVTPTLPIGALLKSRADIRTAVPRTGAPFCSVRTGAVVIPPGTRIFA